MVSSFFWKSIIFYHFENIFFSLVILKGYFLRCRCQREMRMAEETELKETEIRTYRDWFFRSGCADGRPIGYRNHLQDKTVHDDRPDGDQ